MVKTVQISRPITFEPSGAVANGFYHTRTVCTILKRPVCVREVVGSITGRVIPKTFKMLLAALSFALSIEKAFWLVQCQYNVTRWNFTPYVSEVAH